MSSFLLAIGLLLVFGGMLVLPVIRRRHDGYHYYVSGRSAKGDLLLRRRTLLENLRDLEIERELGKLSQADFGELAKPIAHELHGLEEQLTKLSTDQSPSWKPKPHRLGFTCPVCGHLNRRTKTQEQAKEEQVCTQCGSHFH